MNNRYEQLEDELTNLFYTVDGDGNKIPAEGVFFDVKPLPDCEADIKVNLNPKVYVMYDSSDYPETENLNAVVQEDKLKIGFEIHARTRRGDSGVFAIQKMVYSKVLGYKPFGCDKLQLIQFTPLQGSGSNNWMYYAQFITTSHIMESQPEPDEPLLTQVTFVNP